MALKDIWTNKEDGVDDVVAEDINSIAEAVIDLEENGGSSSNGKSPYIGDNGNWYEWNDIQQGYVDTGVKAKGQKGDKGEQGIQGEKGEQGIQGVQGVQGEKGADGYTPQKGVDYWTDSDKEEIKSYVNEAILGGAW